MERTREETETSVKLEEEPIGELISGTEGQLSWFTGDKFDEEEVLEDVDDNDGERILEDEDACDSECEEEDWETELEPLVEWGWDNPESGVEGETEVEVVEDERESIDPRSFCWKFSMDPIILCKIFSS